MLLDPYAKHVKGRAVFGKRDAFEQFKPRVGAGLRLCWPSSVGVLLPLLSLGRCFIVVFDEGRAKGGLPRYWLVLLGCCYSCLLGAWHIEKLKQGWVAALLCPSPEVLLLLPWVVIALVKLRPRVGCCSAGLFPWVLLPFPLELCAQVGSVFRGTFDFERPQFDWGPGYQKPDIPLKDLIIYEVSLSKW